MAHLTRRMIAPDAFTNPDLEPSVRRLLYIGIMQLCEDSGCCPWDAALMRAQLFGYTNLSKGDVQKHMDALEGTGFAWTYETDDKPYAFIPAFPVWNGSLNRWNEPKTVPLPPGIAYEAFTNGKRKGSGLYKWPASRDELTTKRTDVNVGELNPSELKEPDTQADGQAGIREDSPSKLKGKTEGQTTARRRTIEEVDV